MQHPAGKINNFKRKEVPQKIKEHEDIIPPLQNYASENGSKGEYQQFLTQKNKVNMTRKRLFYNTTKKKSYNKNHSRACLCPAQSSFIFFLFVSPFIFYFSWTSSYIVRVQVKIAFGFINQTRMNKAKLRSLLFIFLFSFPIYLSSMLFVML